MSESTLLKKVDEKKEDIVKFLQELIRIPSPTGKEGEVASAIAKKMHELKYDYVNIDEVGNVIGIIKGSKERPSLLYNGHMDTVPPGMMKDAFSGKIMNGKEFGIEGDVIYGRGACDMKGALAAMVIAGGILKEEKINLKGDLIVNGVVMEEPAEEFGSIYVAEKYKPDIAVMGEATNLDVAIGHRGIMNIEITTKGKSCHASNPERGVNALYKMAKVILKVQPVIPTLPTHPFLGKSTMSISTISVIPGATNVIPESCQVIVDIRNIPEFTSAQAITLLRNIITQLKKEDPEFEADVKLMEKEEVSYSGYKKYVTKIKPPFYTDPKNPYIQTAIKVIRRVVGRDPIIKPWSFATDGAAFAKFGAITFGFGPGEEKFSHSAHECIRVDDLIMTTKVYTLLPIYLTS